MDAFDEQNMCIAIMQGYVRRYRSEIGIVWSEGVRLATSPLLIRPFTQPSSKQPDCAGVIYRFPLDPPTAHRRCAAANVARLGMPWAPLTNQLYDDDRADA
jgi:hypothetical protein